MNVLDYIIAADPEKVVALYIEHYENEDGWASVEAFNRFKAHLSEDTENKSDLTVRITYCPGGGEYDVEPSYDVHGFDGEKAWGVAFIPWADLKECPVEDLTEKSLSVDEIATHIFWEFTWYGWPERQQERLNELKESIAQLEEATRNNDFSGFMTLDEFLAELDKSED